MTRSRIEINPDTYTQINTDDTVYMIQNLSSFQIGVIIAAVGDTPLNTENPTHYWGEREGCSNNTTVGIVWAKSRTGENGVVGLTEG